MELWQEKKDKQKEKLLGCRRNTGLRRMGNAGNIESIKADENLGK